MPLLFLALFVAQSWALYKLVDYVGTKIEVRLAVRRLEHDMKHG